MIRNDNGSVTLSVDELVALTHEDWGYRQHHEPTTPGKLRQDVLRLLDAWEQGTSGASDEWAAFMRTGSWPNPRPMDVPKRLGSRFPDVLGAALALTYSQREQLAATNSAGAPSSLMRLMDAVDIMDVPGIIMWSWRTTMEAWHESGLQWGEFTDSDPVDSDTKLFIDLVKALEEDKD